MKTHHHALVGATASVLPDLLLFLFGWRRKWLPESHPLVRGHRFLHSHHGLLFVWLIGWSTHIVIDWFTHNDK
jgi:hypothetical protein